MPSFFVEDSQGRKVDLFGAGAVGAVEGAPEARGTRTVAEEQPVPDPVSGIIRNASWGLSAGLFALPDGVVKGIGKALGMDEKNVLTLTKLFNRGEVAPRNETERYARALAEGAGSGLLPTGILSMFARARPIVEVTKSGAGVMKAIADDAIKFIQNNPRAAFAMDAAYGAAHETMRQAVEENMSDENPNKALWKELLPTAALIGVPMTLATISPTAIAYRFGKGKLADLNASLGELERDAIQDLPKGYRLPGINIAPKVLASRAKEKLVKSLSASADTPEGKAALAALDDIFQDPRIASAGFRYNWIEQVQDPKQTENAIKALSTLPEGSPVLEALSQTQKNNRASWTTLFDKLSPESNMELQAALGKVASERQQFFDNIVKQRKDISEAEAARLSEVYGPLNADRLNGELRGLLMVQMERDADMRRRILRKLGMSQGIDQDGIPVAVRDQAGKSLYPAVDIEQPATDLLKNWNDLLKGRTTMSRELRGFIANSEPLTILQKNIAAKIKARDAMETKLSNDLLHEQIDEQLQNSSIMARIKMAAESGASPESTAAEQDALNKIKSLAELLVKSQQSGVKMSRAEKARLEAESGYGTLIIPESGEIRIRLNNREFLTFNPKTIAADAKRVANANNPIDINIPEALDYLEAAMRFRHHSLDKFNSVMASSRGARLTDADQYRAIGDKMFNDFEQFVLNNVPRVRAEREAMKTVLDDYRGIYEQRYPLIIGKVKDVGGQLRYATPNEKVLATAFTNAEDVRNLSAMIGGDPVGKKLLEQGTLDWLQRKPIFTTDGLINPARLKDVLQKNQNIVSALPKEIQASLQSEMDTAINVSNRLAALKEQERLAQDSALDQFLSKVLKPGTDNSIILDKALSSPIEMAQLVNAVKGDPDRLSALRRSVFDIAKEGAMAGGSLTRFIDKHDTALKQLFSESHLKDLRILADLQARNETLARVTGSVPAFESTSDVLKRLMGVSVPGMMTYGRDVMSGRISGQGAFTGLSIRLLSSMEEQLQRKMLIRAIEDPELAKALANLKNPEQGRIVLRAMQSMGIFPKMMLTDTGIQASNLALQGQQSPIEGQQGLPTIPRDQMPPSGTAAAMLRKLPPAPPTNGMPQMRLPTQPPKQKQQAPLLYPMLFPNDPISQMMQQRQSPGAQ